MCQLLLHGHCIDKPSLLIVDCVPSRPHIVDRMQDEVLIQEHQMGLALGRQEASTKPAEASSGLGDLDEDGVSLIAIARGTSNLSLSGIAMPKVDNYCFEGGPGGNDGAGVLQQDDDEAGAYLPTLLERTGKASSSESGSPAVASAGQCRDGSNLGEPSASAAAERGLEKGLLQCLDTFGPDYGADQQHRRQAESSEHSMQRHRANGRNSQTLADFNNAAGRDGVQDSDFTAVEPFELDATFDYDNVQCTPRAFPYNLHHRG